MKLSVCINTCSGTWDPEILKRAGSFGSGHPYEQRATKLKRVLERYGECKDWLHTLVVGEWHPSGGSGYDYLQFPGPTKSPIDPLFQRHAAVKRALGDVIIFLNDDHFIHEEHLKAFMEIDPLCHITAFSRACYKENYVYKMEDGWPQYVMGHAIALSKEALEQVPWSTVPHSINWDVEHSRLLKASRLSVQYLPHFIAWDIEQGELPE